VTIEGETIYANRAILDIYGLDSIDELNTTPVKKRYTPESYAEFQIRREKRKRGDYCPSEYKVSIVRKDGEVRHLQVLRSEILWNDEEHFQTIYRDITEHKRKELEYSTLIQTSLDGFWVNDFSGRILDVNQAACKMLGYSREELLRMSIQDIDAIEKPEETAAHIRKIIGLGSDGFETRHRRKDGKIIDIEINIRCVAELGERIFVFTRDITDRKRTEGEVQTSREQMRALARRLQLVREEERTLIAREIHDELGGALTGLKIDVSLLTRVVLKIENETVRTSLLAGMDSMIKFTDATIQIVRRIAMELRPGVLDDLGLAAALEWQLKDFEKRTGIRCELFSPGEDISLNADLSTALFRIFQEAMINVVRHSAATEVCVRLRANADSFTLEVEDNGTGIEKEKILGSKSLGLLGMRERAEMFGGHITVTGAPGRGTTVTVEIPLIEKRKMDRDQEGDVG
jgi:PAS domain S-box-containing protein